MTQWMTPRFLAKIKGDELWIAPHVRPADWRVVQIHQLDVWMVKMWRERALDPVAKDENDHKK